MQWTLGTSGAETLSCSANIFVGQTEAPLLVRPFLDKMTLSELLTIMVGGFATIAGGVLAGYIRLGIDAGHLIAASVMSAPAALVIGKIIFP
ncbi:NupC/NupG family nucleoside CNT transporter, partial [Candidatus Saccharibacteria bacterium]|nr:NupC/NupG family nucleoside CNT transporter [Candidatus Saccharibacteria bacterium]